MEEMTAVLVNCFTGEEIMVRSTFEHPTCSYGNAVWVDDCNNPYLQVGMERMQYLYRIKDVNVISRSNK